MQSVDDLRAAREALERHSWREELELFGEAAWWAGEADAMIGARERAQAAGNTARAGRVAVTVALDYMQLEESVSAGWLNRARRLLENHPDSVERAYQRDLADHRRSAGSRRRSGSACTTPRPRSELPTTGGRACMRPPRVGALAEGGEILATEETAADAASSYPTSEPREVRLKGITEPVRVVSLAWQ